jgi:eukaryotic-like serine/threonine-protein kinase
MIGAVLDGRYHLVRLLGEGGMGTVYEAVHGGTGRRVAVKVIARAELRSDDEVVTRFQREAKAAGHIETRHIVEVIDAGRDGRLGLPFIAMEFLVGYDLGKLLASAGPLPPDLALCIVGQACVGLEKAHAENIVHRDIKPANLFLARQPDGIIVKLLDFGIAKVPRELLPTLDAGLTLTGRLMGSPRFMSPEQAQGLKTLDHRTDIWSLGAVLYEALAGIAPFADCETFGQLIVAICSHPPPPLQKMAPWVPLGFARIAERALQIDPGERYPTAAAMLEDILLLLPGGVEIHEEDVAAVAGELKVEGPSLESPRGKVEDQTARSPGAAALTSSEGGRKTPVTIAGVSSDPTLPSAGTDPPPAASGGAPRTRWLSRTRVATLLVGAVVSIAIIFVLRWRREEARVDSAAATSTGIAPPSATGAAATNVPPAAQSMMALDAGLLPAALSVEHHPDAGPRLRRSITAATDAGSTISTPVSVIAEPPSAASARSPRPSRFSTLDKNFE